MSLDIKQRIPTVPIVKNVVKGLGVMKKVDKCSGMGLSDLFGKLKFPDISFPDFDLPSFKLGLGLEMPDFLKFKMDGLSLKGLLGPFKCLLGDMSNPLNKSLSFKKARGVLNNINCKDMSAGLDSDAMRNLALKAALNMSNCSKTPEKAVISVSNDLKKLANSDSGTFKTIIGSVVDTKLDMNAASIYLSGKDVVTKITESIQTSTTSFNKIMRLPTNLGTIKDKNSVVTYSTKVVEKTTLIRNTTIVGLAGHASNDIQNLNKSLPNKKNLNVSQKVHLLSKVGNMDIVFLTLKSKIA